MIDFADLKPIVNILQISLHGKTKYDGGISMTIVCVDDHPIMLKGLAQNIQQLVPKASIYAFENANDAIGFVKGEIANVFEINKQQGETFDGFVGDAPAMLCDAVRMKQVLEMIYARADGVDVLLETDGEIDEKLYKGWFQTK